MRSDNSGQIVQTVPGICALRENPALLGFSSTAGSGVSVYIGSVPAMFDRGLLDMAANDPQKGIIVPGAQDGSRSNPAVPAPGSNPTQNYAWTPLNSWKYWPTSVWMKFRHVLRRTFYNPTNVVQTVFVTEFRRKRAQLSSENTNDLPLDTRFDYEIIDQQPLFEDARTWWQEDSSGSGILIYAPSDDLSGAPMLRMHEAGEMYRRFLYVRFGQYEQIQLASRGFTSVSNEATGGTTGFYFQGMNRWAPELAYGNNGVTGPTDPPLPQIYGYDQPQSVRDNFITTLAPDSTTLDVGDLRGRNNPWNGNIPSGQITTGGFTMYRYDPTYNPMRNPILRRLFHMHRTRYMIPPGGSAAHVYRTGGTAHPYKSRLIRHMRFYGRAAGPEDELPYCLPFSDTYKPSIFAHTTKKVGGWHDVGSFVQVRGQMAYLPQAVDSVTPSCMQYAPARVVFHDRHEVRYKVCSYGIPAIGGTRTHTTFLCPSQTGYVSTNPTAPPSSQFVNLATGTIFGG